MRTTDATPPLDIEVRNLRSGQVIEMTVVGPWTEDGLAARLERLIVVRQPAEIHLRLPAVAGSSLPDLAEARRLLADVGGSLHLERAALEPGDRAVDA